MKVNDYEIPEDLKYKDAILLVRADCYEMPYKHNVAFAYEIVENPPGELFQKYSREKRLYSLLVFSPINICSDDDIQTNRPFRVLHEWVSNKEWRNKVHYYIDEDDESYLKFIIITGGVLSVITHAPGASSPVIGSLVGRARASTLTLFILIPNPVTFALNTI